MSIILAFRQRRRKQASSSWMWKKVGDMTSGFVRRNNANTRGRQNRPSRESDTLGIRTAERLLLDGPLVRMDVRQGISIIAWDVIPGVFNDDVIQA